MRYPRLTKQERKARGTMRVDEKDIAMMRSLRRTGWTYPRIATTLQCAPSTVAYWTREETRVATNESARKRIPVLRRSNPEYRERQRKMNSVIWHTRKNEKRYREYYRSIHRKTRAHRVRKDESENLP